MKKILKQTFAASLTLIGIIGLLALFPTQNVKSDSTSTHQEMLNYQKKLSDLADKLTRNTVDSVNLENDINGRKAQVEEQMRSMQLNPSFSNSNVLYLMIFNNMSLEQALAMSKIISTSIGNIEQLKKDEARLAKDKLTIQNQLNEAQLTYDILNTQFKDEMLAEESAKQATLAAQAEAAKKSLAAVSDKNTIKVSVPANNNSASNNSSSPTPSPSPNPTPTPSAPASNSWADWSPAQAAQYVSNGTGVSATQWLNILYRESGGNPLAVNPYSGTFGYFQMNGAAHGGVDYAAMSPQQYLDAVIALYFSQGAGAWAETW